MNPKNKYRAYCNETKKLVYDGDKYNISNNRYIDYTCRITNLGIFWTQPYNRNIETVCECGNYSDWDMERINSNCDIMQCTGIKDIDGNLIFESDIVSYTKESNLTDQITFIGSDVVKWNIHEGRFELNNNIGMIYKSYKIIGNIYQNGIV